MAKRSVYFPDDLEEEILAEAARDQRSLSQWISITLRAVLSARKATRDGQADTAFNPSNETQDA